MSKHVSSLSSCLFPRQRAAIYTSYCETRRQPGPGASQRCNAESTAASRVARPTWCLCRHHTAISTWSPRWAAGESSRTSSAGRLRRYSKGRFYIQYWLSSQHSQTSRRRRPKGPSKGLAERERRSATTTPRLITAINSFVNAACQAVCPKAARSDLPTDTRFDTGGRLAGGVARRSAALVGWSKDRRGPARGADSRRVNTPLCRRPGGRVVGRPVCINCLLFHDVKMGQQVQVQYPSYH